MKKIILSLLLFSTLASADDAGVPVQVILDPVTNEAFLKLLLESIGGMKGAGALGLAFIVSKLLIALFKTKFVDGFFNKIDGAWKLTVVLVLSLASGVLGLSVAGVPIAAALIHSATLSSFMVLVNQIYKQFFAKEERAPQIPPSEPS